MTPSLSHLCLFVRTHWFLVAMTSLGTVFVALALFEAGIMVGYHEARFSFGLDQNYERTFGAPGIPAQGRMGAPMHGTTGTIVSIALPNITIASANAPEMTVRIASSTLIRNQASDIPASALRIGAVVVILGEPDENDGIVEARLIRVMPSSTTIFKQASSTSTR